MSQSEPSRRARLCAIVSVPPESRVACQQPGCGHGVYAAIHVVEDGGSLLVLGSTCYARRYGGAGLGEARYGGGNGRMLTQTERDLLASNTRDLLARFEEQEAATLQAARAQQIADQRARNQVDQERRQAGFQAPRPISPGLGGPAMTRVMSSPWLWQYPNSSVALMQAPNGRAWVRVQHEDKSQKLVPWPEFDGWEEALPEAIGKPDLIHGAIAVDDIVEALALLKRMGFSAPLVGRWQDVWRSYRASRSSGL